MKTRTAVRIEQAPGITRQASRSDSPPLPDSDNSPGSLDKLQRANHYWRKTPWPVPFSQTTHKLRVSDARDLKWLKDESVHLVVTSPPYWTLKDYNHVQGQMGDIENYERFLDQLDLVWSECQRVLVPGGRICCVVGDVCVPRKKAGRHFVMPLHSDIQVRARMLGLDSLTPIFWFKIANGVNEAEGNGAGFYGKPYQPGAIIKSDFETIVFLRKGGSYRSATMQQRALSMLTRDEMKQWMRSAWTDIKGESTRRGHPAPYPVDIASRLIRMFSFAGDTVLDPFVGTGTTCIAAMRSGRSSIGSDIDPEYIDMAKDRCAEESSAVQAGGMTHPIISH